MQIVKLKGEFIKLGALLKVIAFSGTGGEAKNIILEGRVLVNNEICLLRGKKLHNGDIVSFLDDDLTVQVVDDSK